MSLSAYRTLNRHCSTHHLAIMSSTAAIHAMSPAAHTMLPSMMVNISLDLDDSKSSLVRHLAITSTRTLEELIALVPLGWGDTIGPTLRDVY